MLSASFCVGARKRYLGFGDRSNGRSFKPKKVSYINRALSAEERLYGEGASLPPHRPSACECAGQPPLPICSSVADRARKSPSSNKCSELGQKPWCSRLYPLRSTSRRDPPSGIQLGYLREPLGPVGKRPAVLIPKSTSGYKLERRRSR